MRFRGLRRLLRRFDIVVFRRSSGLYLPEDEVPALVRRLCDRPDPIVVDGGAHKGDFVHSLRKVSPQARFFCFEPDVELARALEIEFDTDDRVTVVAAALGDRSGTAEFSVNQSRATSSLLRGGVRNTGPLRDLMAPRAFVKVDVVTLDEVLARAGVQAVDVIKLDLQGYDLVALRGGTETLERTSVVVVEVWFAPIYESAADYLQLCAWMSERGFELYSLAGLHYGKLDRLLWADAVFVRRSSHAWLAPISH
jgi:FkbM family methyltransferase